MGFSVVYRVRRSALNRVRPLECATWSGLIRSLLIWTIRPSRKYPLSGLRQVLQNDRLGAQKQKGRVGPVADW